MSCKQFLLILLSVVSFRAMAVTDEECQGRLLSAEAYSKYPNSLKAAVKERDFLVDLIEIALLAREHLLIVGPPGNAKSMISDLALPNILVEQDGELKPSYYRIQMTPETTMSETHGPLDYRELSATSRYKRLYDEGMLKKHFGFIDEVFDAPIKLQRNMLVMLVERLHAQGPRIEPGNIQTVIAASNKYINEVYEKAGDDSPKAYFDRYALMAFIPGELEFIQSAMSLVQKKYNQQPIYPLIYSDLQTLQAVGREVKIPLYVAQFLSLLNWRMKGETENLEQSSLKKYRDALRTGEQAEPPYRATKYFSPRTLGKSRGILQAIVTKKWIESKGQRELTVNLEDVADLVRLWTLNGPGTDFVKEMFSRTTNANERNQLQAILLEREIFERNYRELLTEVNAVTAQHNLVEIQTQLRSTITKEEKQKISLELLRVMLTIRKQIPARVKLADFTGDLVGQRMVVEFAEEVLRELLQEKYEKTVAHLEQEFDKIKQQALEEVQVAEQVEPEQPEVADPATAAAMTKAEEMEASIKNAELQAEAEMSKLQTFVDTFATFDGPILAMAESESYTGGNIFVWSSDTFSNNTYLYSVNGRGVKTKISVTAEFNPQEPFEMKSLSDTLLLVHVPGTQQWRTVNASTGGSRVIHWGKTDKLISYVDRDSNRFVALQDGADLLSYDTNQDHDSMHVTDLAKFAVPDARQDAFDFTDIKKSLLGAQDIWLDAAKNQLFVVGESSYFDSFKAYLLRIDLTSKEFHFMHSFAETTASTKYKIVEGSANELRIMAAGPNSNDLVETIFERDELEQIKLVREFANLTVGGEIQYDKHRKIYFLKTGQRSLTMLHGQTKLWKDMHSSEFNPQLELITTPDSFFYKADRITIKIRNHP